MLSRYSRGLAQRLATAPSPSLLRCTCSALVATPPTPFAFSQTRYYASKKKSKGSAPVVGGAPPPPSPSKAVNAPDYDLATFTPAMDAAVDRLRVSLKPLTGRVGPVSPDLLTNLRVSYEGENQPLSAMASITVATPSTLLVKPYDPASSKAIEEAIYASPLNLAPQSLGDGGMKVPIPKVDLDKRDAWVREAGNVAENARVAVRNERTKVVKVLKAELDAKTINKEELRADTKDLDAATKTRLDEIDVILEKAKKLLLDK